MANEITKDDVIRVANSIHQEVSESAVEWILDNYYSWAKDDSTSNWSEVVESMIYSYNVTHPYTDNGLNNFTDEELKAELSKRGFFTDNLWRVDDVKSKFSVNNEEAQVILNQSLTNDATMEQIWLSIDTFGDMGFHRRVDEFAVGDSVLVPDPNKDDLHNHEFLGTIKVIKGEYATVEDMDGDCFDIELDRLEHE